MACLLCYVSVAAIKAWTVCLLGLLCGGRAAVRAACITFVPHEVIVQRGQVAICQYGCL